MKKNWEIKTLGEVCSFENGDRGKNYPSRSARTNEGIAFINAGHLTDEGLDFDNMNYISRERFDLLGSGKIRKGDILFCLRGSLGKFASVGNLSEGAIASSLVIVRPSPSINLEFLMAYFKSKLCSDMILFYGNGAAQPNLSSKSLSKFKIPLPSLSEQQRIVAILEEAFSAIARAKENTEKNLQNARELFESFLLSVFANPGDGWEEKTLGELTTKIGSGATPTGGNSSYKQSGISFIRSMNVYDEGFIIKNLAYIDDVQAKKLDIATLVEGDVLLNITGASIARCCIVPKEILPARVNQHVTILRPKGELISSSFLHYCLISKFNKDRLLKNSRAGGSTREALTKAYLTSFSIFIPKSLSEQQCIVAKLKALSTKTQKLEAIYQQKIANLEELKKSILQKAFNGEL